MSASVTGDPDLASVQKDIAALRSDFGILFEHMKSGAGNGAKSVANQIGEGADDLTQRLARGGRDTTRAIDAWVEQRPWLTFLIAIGVGYVGARLIQRSH